MSPNAYVGGIGIFMELRMGKAINGAFYDHHTFGGGKIIGVPDSFCAPSGKAGEALVFQFIAR